MESYFFTLATYGSRLPGDARGTLSRKGEFIVANPRLHEVMEELSSPAVYLDFGTRAILFDAIISYGRDVKIVVDAVNVRTEHLHMLLTPLFPTTPEYCVHAFKRKMTNVLRNLRNYSTVPRYWARSYYCATLTSYKAWYNRLCYTLYDQGDNSYVNLTKFARRLRGELNERTLREGFVPSGIHAYRKRTLRKESDNVVYEQLFVDEPPTTRSTCREAAPDRPV